MRKLDIRLHMSLTTAILSLVSYCSINANVYAKDNTAVSSYPLIDISGEEARKLGLYYNIDTNGILYVSCTDSKEKEIIIPESIDSHKVDYVDFAYCDNLETIMLPKTISNVVDVYNCPSIKSYYVDEQNESYCSVDGVLYNKECTKLLYYPALKEDKKYTVPECVEEINDCAFIRSKYLEEVSLPGTLTYIGQEAFALSENIKSIEIPANVSGAMAGAFIGCETLETITFLREYIVSDPLYYLYDYMNVLDYCEAWPVIYVPDAAIEDYRASIQSDNYTLLPLSQKTDKNIISGDANIDFNVSLADSVLVLQAFSNPDVYGVDGTSDNHITELGMVNADVYEVGSGLTPQDALSIQKYLLRLISKLPE